MIDFYLVRESCEGYLLERLDDGEMLTGAEVVASYEDAYNRVIPAADAREIALYLDAIASAYAHAEDVSA